VKKNLIEDSIYEFRVRSVLEAEDGVLGLRSAWHGPIVVNLLKKARPHQPAPKAHAEPQQPPREPTQSQQPKPEPEPKAKEAPVEAEKTPKWQGENYNKNQRQFFRKKSESPRSMKGAAFEAQAPAYSTPPKVKTEGPKNKVDKPWEINTDDANIQAHHTRANANAKPKPNTKPKAKANMPRFDDLNIEGAEEVEEEEGVGIEGEDEDGDAQEVAQDDVGDVRGFAQPKGGSPRWADMQRRKAKREQEAAARAQRAQAAASPSIVTGTTPKGTKSMSAEDRWFVLNSPGSSNDYQHPVFAEPLAGSRLVGYLVSGLPVEMNGVCGDWAKVRVHRRLKRNEKWGKRREKSQDDVAASDLCADDRVVKWGWCERTYEQHVFLRPNPSLSHGSGSKAASGHRGGENDGDEEDQLLREEQRARLLGRNKRHSISGRIDTSNLKHSFAEAGDDAAAAARKAAFGASNDSANSANSDMPSWAYRDKDAERRGKSRRPQGPDMGSTLEKKGSSRRLAGADSDDESDSDESTNTDSGVSTEGGADSDDESKDTFMPTPNEWHECYDDQGRVYYYNAATQESRWEPPEWVEEKDPTSGASYYVKLNKSDAKPLHSTWSRPDLFARIIRATEGEEG